MWGQFDTDKIKIKNEFNSNVYNYRNGLNAEELKAGSRDLINSLSDKPKPLQKAKLFEYILKNAEIEICPFDFFADKINHCNLIIDLREKWKNETEENVIGDVFKKNNSAQRRCAYTGDVDFSHTAPDWQNILDLGIVGLLDRINECEKGPNLTEKQRIFYKSCKITYSSVIDYMKRMADLAKEHENENPKMKMLATIMDNLCVKAPQTLLEAMELTFIFYYLQTYVEGVNVRTLGAIDRLYFKFYDNDIKSGMFNEKQQREIIKYFLYRMGAINAIANTPICLCSGDSDEMVIINDLTYVIIEEYASLKIADPKLHIRYKKGFPEKLLKKLFDMIRNGNNSIVFMNDAIVSRALENIGIEKADASDYVPIGCYEPAAFRREVPCSCSGRINLLKAVELALTGGYDIVDGDFLCHADEECNVPDTFENFIQNVKMEIKCFVDNTIELINEYEKNYIDINPAPLFSATFDECMQNGVDAYEGGAKYNNTSINLLGLASAVDSLIVIKHIVFEQGVVTIGELTEILKNNWNDNEKLRLKCSRFYSKYGNNIQESNELAAYISEYAASLINGRKNERGGVYRCGMFSIDWYGGFGCATGASADGRLEGEPISKNICAVIGKDKEGVTELINTVTSIDFTKFPNGSVLDVMLHPSAISGDDGLKAAIGLFLTFMKKGGMAFQCNVLNPEILKKARKNPKMFQNLQVRLCGWNVYFVNLSEREQSEFIKMAENTEI